MNGQQESTRPNLSAEQLAQATSLALAERLGETLRRKGWMLRWWLRPCRLSNLLPCRRMLSIYRLVRQSYSGFFASLERLLLFD